MPPRPRSPDTAVPWRVVDHGKPTPPTGGYWLLGVAAVVTALVYLPALRGGFVEWDDNGYVVENFHIRDLNLTFLRWAFTTFHQSNWHPLTWTSHALDYAAWGLRPEGHHLTSLVLHVLNTFLVGVLATLLVTVAREHDHATAVDGSALEREALVAGAATAILFGIHPLHVESVAWVAERKDVLCAAFVLLSALAYCRFAVIAPSPGIGAVRNGWRAYLSALGCFAAALLAKPMAVTLPCLLLVLDAYPFRRISSWRLVWVAAIEKLPFALLSIGAARLTLAAQHASGALGWTEVIPLSTRVLVAARSLVAYLAKMAFPLDLVPFYPYPMESSWTRATDLLPVVLVLAATIAALTAARSRPWWLAIWTGYVISLIPVLGIVQAGAQAMADRYTYLPSFGPFLLAGVGIARVLCRVRHASRGKTASLLVAAAVALTMAGLGYRTLQQIAVWRSSLSLWDYVIEREPTGMPLAYNNRGLTLLRMDQHDRAIADYTRAIELVRASGDKPSTLSWQPYVNRGVALLEKGEADRAIEDFNVAISMRPLVRTYYLRGMAYEAKGMLAAASQDYARAKTLDASFVEAYVGLGVLRGKTGSFNEAMQLFDQAIAIDPNHPLAYGNRAFAHALAGRSDQALRDFERAVRLDPTNPKLYFNRGGLLLRLGDRNHARADYRRACELGDPTGCEAAEWIDR